MNSQIIKFPVAVHIPKLEIEGDYHRYKKHITKLPPDWTHISESMDIQEYDEYNYIGVATGRRSDCTIVDVSYNSPLLYQLVSIEMTKSIRTVRTPNNGFQYMFLYEKSLESIYSTRKGVNIYNDNRFALRGKRYRVSVDQPLTKMPDQLLRTLLDYQNNPESIHCQSYELLSILPREWFTERERYMRLIHTLRNIETTNKEARATMRKLLVDQHDYVDERELLADFSGHMNSKQKRLTLTGLAKVIKVDYPQEYAEWHIKWKSRRSVARAPKKKMYYKHGALVKLCDLKAVQYDITVAKLLKKNAEWTSIIKNICTYCKERHKKGCCDDYNRNKNSSCLFINNIEIR